MIVDSYVCLTNSSKKGGNDFMSCLHIQYDGGDYNCYRCDLCGKRWDWGDAHVEHVCKDGESYRHCPIWEKYSY